MAFEFSILIAFATMICWSFGDFFIQRSTRKIGNAKLKKRYRKVKEKLLKKYVDYFFSSVQKFDDWALSSAW